MSVDLALLKVLESRPEDLLHFLSSFPAQLLLRREQVKGTAGGATGMVEYAGYAPSDATLNEAKWLIVKFVYDSTGFNTQALLAGGEAKFNKVFNAAGGNQYASYTYTTS